MTVKRKLTLIILVLLIIALPILLIVIKQSQDNRSRAAAPDQLEAEGGVLGGNVQAKQDQTASGGNYVAFANQTPTLTPISTGATFYVSPSGSDSNSGIQTSPWKTIQKAANTLKAGETAILLDGTYTESGIEFKTNDGTQSSPITIKAQNKWGAILASTSSNQCGPSISINRSWITIDGLRITSSPGAVDGCSAPSSANGAARCWGSNVPTSARPSTGWVGCTFRNVKVDQSPVKHVGIKTNQDYSLVENSEIHNALEAFNNLGTIFRNNVIYDGDIWGSYLYGKGGVRNMQIYNNIVHAKNIWEGIGIGGTSGCCWWDETNKYEAYNSVVYNNVIINESGGGTGAGLGMQGAVSSAIFNNVVIKGHMYMAPGAAPGYSPRNYPINPFIKNNIIDCGGGSATSGWTYTGTLSLDYNLFYNCTGVPSQTHPVNGNPNFVNPTSDWRLQPGSPAMGTGIPVTFTGYNGEAIDVSHNFEGLLRSIPWNLGIY